MLTEDLGDKEDMMLPVCVSFKDKGCMDSEAYGTWFEKNVVTVCLGGTTLWTPPVTRQDAALQKKKNAQRYHINHG